jgi:hypothetical protein
VFELDFVSRHDGEVLGWNAVAFGRVAIAGEGGAHLALAAGRQDDAARDAVGERLLEDAAIDDLDGPRR